MKILIQDKDGVRKLEEGYASERELQVFLRDHSDLIPVDEIELGTPPLLCIGWEVGVASGTEDLLYVDETGLLTIVETKLRRNPEARREVVGQVLEYAAQACSWSPQDVELRAQKFFSSQDCPQECRGQTLEQALRYFLQRTESPAAETFVHDDFLNLVSSNLERGHIRLVIAIDEPPEPLLRIVEFVNRFSERFEMYLIQLKRFHDITSGENIFVPALFGRVATTRPTERTRTLWDESRFLEQLTAHNEAQTVERMTEAYRRFQEWADEGLWGSGKTYGSFNLVVRVGAVRVNLATITTRGDLGVNFGWMQSKIPEELIGSLVKELGAIDGLTLPGDAAKKWPLIPRAVLRDRQRFEQVMNAISEAVKRIRALE